MAYCFDCTEFVESEHEDFVWCKQCLKLYEAGEAYAKEIACYVDTPLTDETVRQALERESAQAYTRGAIDMAKGKFNE